MTRFKFWVRLEFSVSLVSCDRKSALDRIPSRSTRSWGNRRWNAKQSKGWAVAWLSLNHFGCHSLYSCNSTHLSLSRWVYFGSQTKRCAHLDKLNYKLDGSLVATRGNVVAEYVWFTQGTRFSSILFLPRERMMETRGKEARKATIVTTLRSKIIKI